jgi:hypothetical protein
MAICGFARSVNCSALPALASIGRRPRPADDDDLALLRRIDEPFPAWPFLGSRRVTVMLRGEGYAVNRKRAQRLLRKVGIVALGPKPRTTKPARALMVAWRAHLDGRPRSLGGQCVHRAVVALAQARGRLPQRLSDGREAHTGIASWFAFYNARTPTKPWNNGTPMVAWRERISGWT